MQQTITLDVEVPEGKVVSHIVNEDGTVTIRFVNKYGSRTWEEFCENNPFDGVEYFIKTHGIDKTVDVHTPRKWYHRGYLSSQEEAEGILALIQLIRLRKEWISNVPIEDVKTSMYYGIYYERLNRPECFNVRRLVVHSCLEFPTKEMAEEFIFCFKYLLEKAKEFI